MKKLTLLMLILVIIQTSSSAQNDEQFYFNEKDQKHLCGPFDLSVLENDTTYAQWYEDSQKEFEPQTEIISNTEALKNMTVDVYLGSWCGDSKNWVPKFVELWDSLGLKREQLHFIALFDGDDKYKQGPNGEEKGKNIHRVPTFIFSKDGQEVARIVEHPHNDLEVDLAQISLGVPSKAAYKGANYLMHQFEELGVEGVRENFKTIVNKAYRLQSKSSELNTLGYVYLRSGEIEKALTTFYMNTLCHRYNPNVYDSYAEALEVKGNTEYAIQFYEKSLTLNPENEHAIERLAALKADDE